MSHKLLVEAITIAVHGGTGFHSVCSSCGKWQKTSFWANENVELKHEDLIKLLADKKTYNDIVIDEVQALKDEIQHLKGLNKSLRDRETK